MSKITLQSGTMLASNASNHVRSVQLAAIPTRRPVSTKAMKISPWAIVPGSEINYYKAS